MLAISVRVDKSSAARWSRPHCLVIRTTRRDAASRRMAMMMIHASFYSLNELIVLD